MSYASCESALQTLLQALDQYADPQVTRGDYDVLDGGYTQCCVLRPGPFTARESGDWGQNAYDWILDCTIYERWVGDGSEWTNLETQRQNVLDQVGAYPTLNGVSGVTRAAAERAGEIAAVYPRGSDMPAWLMQTIRLQVHEEVVYSSGEFAT
jgi:hypothetical protein